jgi:hypothetical protein
MGARSHQQEQRGRRSVIFSKTSETFGYQELVAKRIQNRLDSFSKVIACSGQGAGEKNTNTEGSTTLV